MSVLFFQIGLSPIYFLLYLIKVERHKYTTINPKQKTQKEKNTIRRFTSDGKKRL